MFNFLNSKNEIRLNHLCGVLEGLCAGSVIHYDYVINTARRYVIFLQDFRKENPWANKDIDHCYMKCVKHLSRSGIAHFDRVGELMLWIEDNLQDEA